MSGTSSEAPKRGKPKPKAKATPTSAQTRKTSNGATRSGQRRPGKRTAIPEAEIHSDVQGSSYRSMFRTMGSCVCSMVVHMSILIVMALWVLPMVMEVPRDLTAVTERDQEELTQTLDNLVTPATNITSSAAALTQGHEVSLDTETQPTFDSATIEQSDIKVKVSDTIELGGRAGANTTKKLPEGMFGDPQMPVENMQQAMDRLTREILLMLEDGKVQVTWLFDESESMKDEQRDIRNKVERVYKELGLLNAINGDALTTGVASYGEKLHIHTQKPTFKVEVIKADMDKVPVDDSGTENMCYAVGQTIRYYQKYARLARRQMALILVTDESGDPEDSLRYLEQAVDVARAARCRIYVLGREAVFGYPYAYLRWQDPKTKITYWLRIDRGPETPFVEQLQTNGFWRRWDAHGSGFGPYEQSRMAKLTGGIFFILPSPETNLVRGTNFVYEIERMRPFLPSLESREDYLRERSRSPLQQVLWKVINDLNPWDPQKAKYINMRDDFSINPVEFQNQANVELAKAAQYVKYLYAAEQALDKHLPVREREIYPRWRANFDLIHAQVIAYKVRIYQYGAYLHWWKTHPDERPKPALKPPRNNPNLVSHWDIATRHKPILTTDRYPEDKMNADIARATAMFERIVKDYAGTPWEKRAAWELRRGFGVHVVQAWDDRRRGVGVKLPKP